MVETGKVKTTGIKLADPLIPELKEEIQGVRTGLKEDMAVGFKTLGDKVEGHEDRIRFLERKVA